MAGSGELPAVDAAELWLPTQYEEAPVVAPNWDSEPQEKHGIYLGAAADEEVLRFSAVDSVGTELWSVERPLSCTGFALSVAESGRPVAVVTDAEQSDTAISATTATGYDLETGEQLWGPVHVPGPHQGPGLVFASPSAEYMGGSTGPRTALDPTTGAVAFAEDDEGTGPRVIGEFDGAVLIVDSSAVTAQSTRDGALWWSHSLADSAWQHDSIQARPGQAPGEPFVVLETGESTHAVVDLATGAILSEVGSSAALDTTSGVLAVLAENQLHGIDPAGETLWQLTVSPGTSMAAAGGVFLYLRDGEAVRAHNMVTGAIAQAYDPDGAGRIVVPAHIPAMGAALLLDGGRYLVATVPDVEVPQPARD